VFLEERFGVVTARPGLFARRVCDLMVEIEVRHSVDHGAIGE
jgi:hypothetical protein